MKTRLTFAAGGLALSSTALCFALLLLLDFEVLSLVTVLWLFAVLVLTTLAAAAWGAHVLTARGEKEMLAGEALAAEATRRFGLYWEHSAESLFAVRVEPDGRFVYEGMNPTHEKRSGLRSGQIAGLTPHECLSAKLADEVMARFRQCIAEGAPIRYQQSYDFPAAPGLLLDMVLIPLWNAQHSRIVTLLGSGRDVTELDRRRREAESARRLFEGIVEASPDIVFVDRYLGRNLYVNAQAERILGYSEAEIQALGDDFLRKITHPDDYSRIAEGLRAVGAAADHESVSYDYRLRTTAGEWRWFSSRIQAFRRDEQGEVTEIVGVASDVTSQRQALAELHESESRFRLVADTIPDMLYMLDGRDNSCFINRSFQTYTGQPAIVDCDELRLAVVHPEDLFLLEASRREADGAFQHELRIRAADGGYQWFSNKGRIVRNADGSIERLFGVAINIHELKAAEDRARGAKERLEATLFAVGDCFIGLDADLRITEVNGPAIEWFGAPEEDLRGQNFFAVFAHKDGLAGTVELALAEQRPVRVARRSAFASDRWIEFNVYPSAKGIGILFHDITDRRLAEQQKEELTTFLQSTIDALSAGVAIVDRGGTIVAVNQAWLAMCEHHGFDPGSSAVGQSYLASWIHAAEGLGAGADLKTQLDGIIEQGAERFETILRIGSESRWLLVKAARFIAGETERIVIAHEDVTEVSRRDAELRSLSAQLLETQDAERRRIARELHDSTAQHLVGIQLGFARLRDKLPADEQTQAVVDDIRTALRDAQQEVRVLSYLLHPPALEKGDLVTALDRFVAGYSARTGLEVRFRTNVRALELAEDAAVTLMRVAQEALANVLKHSGASKAIVRLQENSGWLVLDILDDGIGIAFDPETEAHAGLGVGLPGMKARLLQLGGTFLIRRRSGKGTVVRAAIPIRH